MKNNTPTKFTALETEALEVLRDGNETEKKLALNFNFWVTLRLMGKNKMACQKRQRIRTLLSLLEATNETRTLSDGVDRRNAEDVEAFFEARR